MKKYAVILLLIFALALSGCAGGKKPAAPAAASPTPEPAYTVEPTPSTVERTVPQLSVEKQQELIMAEYENWRFTWENASRWYYGFTDLDRNGRLEVISWVTQGTGVFTTAYIHELSEDFSSLVKCEDNSIMWHSYPEIGLEQTVCYYDSAEDRYWYVFEDATKNGYAEQYISRCALSLKDGIVELRHIARGEFLHDYESDTTRTNYYDAEGLEISESEYNTAADKVFIGLEKSTQHFEWTEVYEVIDYSLAPDPALPAPLITKNPSSESLSVGGKTWFIAHADNAESISWLFTAPDGSQYDIEGAMRLNPGLYLEMLPEDTIAVSNVPASLSGWAIQAVFEGPGGSAATTPAYIYVDNYQAAYEPIIEKYYTAYATGNTSVEYAQANGLSYLIRYAEPLGYALKDIDKNGIPELIIAPITEASAYPGAIYELYTLSGGNIVKLIEGGERARYYLLSDNRLYLEGSSGAAYQTYEFYRLDGAVLTFIEGFQSYNSSDTSGSVIYHTTVPATEFSGVYGDYDRYDATGSREQAEAIFSSVRQMIWMPQLTAIY